MTTLKSILIGAALVALLALATAEYPIFGF